MHTIQGYYDGQNVQLLEEAPARKPQKVQVVFADVAENRAGADESLEERFEWLYAKWYEDTAPISGSAIFNHPNYQKMIDLGKAAIPLMLKKLKEKPHYLFSALEKITGEDPVPKEHAGRFDLIRNDWFEWGKQNGYRL